MGPQVDNPESFGQYLRRERELREIKLEEIASYTRIKPRALMAIEQDDFASLPPLAFVRAFVRCYADYIGLSIPDVMLRFDTFVQNRYPELTGEVPVLKGPKAPRQSYIAALLLVVVALLAVLAWWMSREPIKSPGDVKSPDPTAGALIGATNGNLPPTDNVLMLPGSTLVTPGTTVAPGTTSASGSTASPEPGETVRPSPDATAIEGMTIAGATVVSGTTSLARVEVSPLPGATATLSFEPPKSFIASRTGVAHQTVLTVKADCWIGYTLDNDKKGEITLRPGQSIKLEAGEKIILIIGNPNAITALIHNGKPGEFQPRCSPQYLVYPAGPDDKQCYPRPAPPRPAPTRTAPAPAPGRTSGAARPGAPR